MRKLQLFLIIIFGGLCLTVRSTWAGEVVAYIVDYDDTHGSIDVQRDAGTIPVEIGTPLEIDDVLRVKESAPATIDDGRGTSTVVVAAASPYEIHGGGFLAIAQGEVARIMQIVRWQTHEGAIRASTRASADLVAPLFDVEAPAQKLVAGPNNLVIEWFDGIPPFRCSLIVAGQVVFDALVPAERQITIPRTLARGPAKLRLSDGASSVRIYALDVVDSLPPALAKLPFESHSPLERIKTAAALTRYENGAFMLEAVSLLSESGATKAEVELREALEMGERP